MASLATFVDPASSRFEKLILLSYLRDSKGDRRLDKLTREFSEGQVIAALRQLHMDAFLTCLNMRSSERQADIQMYLEDPEDRTRMIASLAETGRVVSPPEAKQHEAELFTHDLETLQVSLGGNPLGSLASGNSIDFRWCSPEWSAVR
jgi:hypothetical protein